MAGDVNCGVFLALVIKRKANAQVLIQIDEAKQFSVSVDWLRERETFNGLVFIPLFRPPMKHDSRIMTAILKCQR